MRRRLTFYELDEGDTFRFLDSEDLYTKDSDYWAMEQDTGAMVSVNPADVVIKYEG